jgi:OPA family glycerol-3-phosphate transporter-like MFS transporter 1/2
MGLWNSHTSLGNILGTLLAAAYVNTAWGLSFVVPGLLMAAAGLLIHLFLVSSPAQVGLASSSRNLEAPISPSSTSPPPTALLSIRIPPPSNLKRIASSPKLQPSNYQQQQYDSSGANSDSDTGSSHGSSETAAAAGSAIGFLEALRIPGVVEFSLCLFFAKLVSYTFLYWLPNYINSTSGIDAKESANLSTFFDIGGIVGGILAGLLSDRSGMSATTCAGLLLAAIPTLFMYQHLVTAGCPLTTVAAAAGTPVMDNCLVANMLVLAVTGALVNGPYALITTAVSAELGTHRSLRGGANQRALATVTAIIDGTGSVGAAAGPLLAGWLTAGGSWDGVFSMLMASNVMALVFLSRLVRQELRRWFRRRWAC